jgi:ketosteroid isomerase-like protein
VSGDDRLAAVRALLATVGDNDVEAALRMVTEDVTFVDVLAPLEATVRDVRGEPGLRTWFAGLHGEGVEHVSAEPFDLQDVGDGRVAGAVRVRQRRADGDFAMVVYGLWEFAEERIERINSYFDRELVLRDAGLSPESGVMRRWVEGTIREKFTDRKAICMDSPEFDGNEFSVPAELWEALVVGGQGFAEVDRGQLLSWQPFDAALRPG